jgi:hypothetical protein
MPVWLSKQRHELLAAVIERQTGMSVIERQTGMSVLLRRSRHTNNGNAKRKIQMAQEKTFGAEQFSQSRV